MQELAIDATKSTPRIFFDKDKKILEIKGESYPENTSEFYDPFFKWLYKHLEGLNEESFTVNIELIYFNSSSSKILMNLFDRLEENAEGGKNIAVNWIYDKKNESSLEYGEEFKEDLTTLKFNLVEKD
ncbi:MAG: DUF1987 domain-containing protein [Nitrospirae bacterium]|nr:DUF1987 domain-containing protein [Nitrospirota bacterium]MBF0534081.1 DUF1987 domain-containing protein [Nitrospirota bacterium]MBF0616240.1 DUF1987 domain-containing protein [Nitrospirota bacterium]